MSEYFNRELTNAQVLPDFKSISTGKYSVERYTRTYDGLKSCDWTTRRLAVYLRTLEPEGNNLPRMSANGAARWNGLLPRSQLLVLPADCPLTTELRGKGASQYTALYLESDWFVKEASRFVDPQHLLIDAKYSTEDDTLAGLVMGLANPGRSEAGFERTYREGLLSCAVMHILNRYSNLAGIDASQRSRLAPATLRRLKDYIEANLANDVSLDELSNVCGLSTFHMARSFKSDTGETIHRYIIRRRVERACELLRSTDMPVTEVAFEVGYQRVATMNHNFKTILGTSPTAYRQINV